jgi:hypothetical protein
VPAAVGPHPGENLPKGGRNRHAVTSGHSGCSDAGTGPVRLIETRYGLYAFGEIPWDGHTNARDGGPS